uniref:Uncharacterized protein n=1 Tax=Promethearchaeum syntrophicum TaxID=2594042 RepID=A0A5B9DEW5_9ARCH|nr:hypothetical protein DSAG12_03707 [Candidatus Prometheoarchaeum syntrophicum]
MKITSIVLFIIIMQNKVKKLLFCMFKKKNSGLFIHQWELKIQEGFSIGNSSSLTVSVII